ncbi:MAG: OmpA family protein [Saprospiraceae bacterium]|nr:OmpA family protein [Saprospiraceae bacterium]
MGVTAGTGRYHNQHEICFRKLNFTKPITTLQFHPREAKLLLRGNIFSLEVAYQKGSDALDTDQMSELTKVIHVLKEYPDFELELNAHVHETINSQMNQDLSLQRAQNIRKYLLQQGVARDRIHLNGMGDKYPLDPESPTNKYIDNTRIEIRFYNPRT